MDWEKAVKVSDGTIRELLETPFVRTAVIGALSPLRAGDEPDFMVPSHVSVEFELESSGQSPNVTIEGSGLRLTRGREHEDSEQMTSGTVTSNLLPFKIDCSRSFPYRLLHSWEFKKSTERIPKKAGERWARVRSADRGLLLSLYGSCDNGRVRLVVKNEGPLKTSHLLGFSLKIRLFDSRVKIPEELGRRKVHPDDVPLYVETVNCACALDKTRTEITLKPYALYDENRVVPVEAEPWTELPPIPVGTELPPDLLPHFQWAATEVSKALAKVTSVTRPYKFQYEARRPLYSSLAAAWRDGKTKGVIIPTPPATGKSEINYDVACVAALVAAKRFGDPGTVAVIAEPLRALASEQMERLFAVLALINDGMKRKVTLGFYMGKVPYQPAATLGLNDVPISRCPFCEKPLTLSYDGPKGRMVPKCDACGRIYDWVYLTVTETESFVPNIVMATLDKLCAQEGRNLNVHAFLGKDFVRCAGCGRVRVATSGVRNGSATCFKCGTKLDPSRLTRSAFSVLVIDEPHSFAGSVGSNAGMFTASELALSMTVRKEGVLVVGSSATIKQGERLLHHLAGCNYKEVVVFPKLEERDIYFAPSSSPHRRFHFLSPCMTNRRAIPRAIVAIKKRWDDSRGPGDAMHLPQVVFTIKRAEAYNVHNDLIHEHYIEKYGLQERVITGEEPRPVIENALDKLARGEIDVLVTTLDLIALGINIPSISVAHFDGMPADYAKFVQGYSRAARGSNDAGLVFLWLRPNVPPENYYIAHHRDLFLYRDALIPIVPINRWFPETVKNFVPAGVIQYGLFTDPTGSRLYPASAAREYRSPEFESEFKSFLKGVMSDRIYDEDLHIAMTAADEGFGKLKGHISIMTSQIHTAKSMSQLLQKILPRGIRGMQEQVELSPKYMNRALITSRVAQVLREAGLYEDEPDAGPDVAGGDED